MTIRDRRLAVRTGKSADSTETKIACTRGWPFGWLMRPVHVQVSVPPIEMCLSLLNESHNPTFYRVEIEFTSLN